MDEMTDEMMKAEFKRLRFKELKKENKNSMIVGRTVIAARVRARGRESSW